LSSRFQRFVLPGLAFKAVVIGGGYATGRELAEFFLPSGPQGGLLGMCVAMFFWSLVCALTFALAQASSSADYRSFFKHLLGPGWILFEAVYVLFAILILAVFGAAAGEMGGLLMGWPPIAGTLVLIACICVFAAFGNASVEGLFKWVSFFLYGVYAIFVVLSLFVFGGRIGAHLSTPVPTTGWITGGLTYASYNVVGAVIVLPVLRHLRNRRDAYIAGVIAGPLAMLPALLFFICMIAFYPEIANERLPSDFLLRQLNMPVFHYFFQIMIFLALLESGTGFVHAINERVALAYSARLGRAIPVAGRLLITVAVLVGSIFLAQRFGLVTLIARGYRALAYIILAVFVLPLLTLGVMRLAKLKASAVQPTH
jgi:uncharacterized membrane protein YkvI